MKVGEVKRSVRLDKLLSDQGIGTRSEVKELIRKGRVKVNGETVRRPELSVTESDTVSVDGEELRRASFEYWLLYKPAGFLTAVQDAGRPVVMELIPSKRKGLSPVGRLDLETEGILLVTDDGLLAHRLLSPKYHVEKTYYAELASDLPADAAERFSRPMEFSDFMAAPAVSFEELEPRAARLTIAEGKYHQVRRMFAKIGCEVVTLRRESFGFLTLEGLKPGEARSLTEKEVRQLREVCRMMEHGE